MLHLYVCLDLLHFVSLSTIYGVERNVAAYCHSSYVYGVFGAQSSRDCTVIVLVSPIKTEVT